jgi:hypothetical protein
MKNGFWWRRWSVLGIRVSSQTLLDLLEIPQSQRRAGLFRRLARVMTELGGVRRALAI